MGLSLCCYHGQSSWPHVGHTNVPQRASLHTQSADHAIDPLRPVQVPAVKHERKRNHIISEGMQLLSVATISVDGLDAVKVFVDEIQRVCVNVDGDITGTTEGRVDDDVTILTVH